MQNALRAALVLGVLVMAGCASSAAEYVELNSGGNYVVRGTVVSIEALSSHKWEQLIDGFALITDEAGCVVSVEQELASGGSKKTRFELISGDHIILTGDGSEGDDFVISALRNKVGIGVDPSGQKEDDPDPDEGDEDE